MNLSRLFLVFLPAALAACASPERAQAVSAEGLFDRSEGTRVVDAEGSHETTWDYLQAKYDADGDGQVSLAEYDRGEESYARHDKNGDGTVSFADYDPEVQRKRSEARRVAARAQPVLALYFQDDADPDRFDLAELERALAVYDAAGDGAITFDEFEANKGAFRAHGKEPKGSDARRLEEGDPYEHLIVAIDDNADGSMTNGEVVAFFHRQADEEGAWDLSPTPREAAGPGGRPTGPDEGAVAPDFTLQRLGSDGAVTLSSFAGDRPVALVFGSYT
jgi:hypothetical protein